MKQSVTIITAVIFYLGSLSVIDSAIARDHDHGKNDGKPIRMLFHNIDMSEDQRKQVKEIMKTSLEQGKELRKATEKEVDQQRDAIKSRNREALSTVLNEEQMSQFDENARRINMGRENRDKHRGKMDKKSRMKGGKHNKGGDHNKRGKHKKGHHQRPHQE